MDQEREKLARLEEQALEIRDLAREAMEEALPSQQALRDGAAAYLRTEHARGALVEYLTDIAKRLMEQWGDLRAEQVRRDRDMEWWEAIVLVDNVAPEPAAAKQWLLNLAAYEREQVRRETVDLACAAVEEYDRPGGPVLFTADSERIVTRSEHIRRRAFAASQGGTDGR